jgi:precorrin-6Y C5,15-methyltransferase (decarboxylating)
MSEPVIVIGVGVQGLSSLTPQAVAQLEQADQLWGSERLLALLPEFAKKRVTLGKGITTALEQLKSRRESERIVLLASGDPGFFGLGSTLLEILPPEQVVLIPQVTSLQAAFARAHVSWQDAHFTSVHARPLTEVIGLARRFRNLGILTDPHHTPALIAKQLLAAGIPDCRAIVCENLGETSEAITDTRLTEIIGRSFSDLNVLLLVQDSAWRPAPLTSIRPDEAYGHRNGLITKSDIRALCLARLALRETDIVWDIGAGSGAVSIEMAEQAWRGCVYAIEKDSECLGFLRENVARFGILNVKILAGEAPSALQGLPIPNAVFLGGSGGQLQGILEAVAQVALPGCRMTATFAVLENMLQAFNWMRQCGWNPSLAQAQMAYGAPISDGTRLSPSNPIFILSGEKI